jgi:predicted RNA-binding protein associated with RNAse of E/G family
MSKKQLDELSFQAALARIEAKFDKYLNVVQLPKADYILIDEEELD